MIRHYFFGLVFLLAGFISSAQVNITTKYFVYLQTEPSQPFYIKINGQQFSANASGYLILPQLKDGDYKLVVGFPQEKYIQQTYNFTIDSKDKGYLIKDFGAEGWGLFDLQTMVVQKPLSANEAKEAIANKKTTPQQSATVPKEGVSDFTKVLAKAANDPSLLEKPKEEPKPVVIEEKKEVAIVQPKPVVEEKKVMIEETSKPVVIETGDSAVVEIVSSAPQQSEKKPVEEVTPAPEVAPVVPNANNSNKPSVQQQVGVMLVYDNKNEKGQFEPVTIFIPEPQTQVVPAEKPKAEVAAPAIPEPVANKIEEVTQEPAAKEESAGKSVKVEEKPAIPQDSVKEEQKVVNTNSACTKIADENDFLKLRRQMSQNDTDQGMISSAKTAFRSKCYTTAQIKYLSSMFLSNAGKYNFYEMARAHVADSENFASLRSEIKDDYYLGKFDALVGQ